MSRQTTSLLPRGDGAHSWTSCSGNRRALLLKMAARSCSTRRPGSRLPEARRHHAARQTFVAVRGISAHRARRRRRNPVQRESKGSAGGRAGGCSGQCRASSRRELHHAWHLAMAEARFCSTPRQGWRRKAPVRTTQASQPQGASPRVAPAGGGEILFNASPRIAPEGFLFSLRHHAPRRASRP